MVSQSNGTNATERVGYRKRGKSIHHKRNKHKIYPRQESQQGLDREMKQPILIYDSGLSGRLERLSREIEEIERKWSLYNNPISTDNFL
jgi:hypothetical protein